MIKHVVLFKLAPFAEGNSKEENARYLKAKLEELPSLIPELLKMEVHINDSDASQDNYDLILISEFNNLADLNAYNIYPEHQKIASFLTKVRTERAAIDYSY